MTLERWQLRTKLLLYVTDKRARGEEPDLSQQDVYDYALAWGYWRGVAAALRAGVLVGDLRMVCLDAEVADTAASPVALARICNMRVEEGFSWHPEELIGPLVEKLMQICKKVEPAPKDLSSCRVVLDTDDSLIVHLFQV